MSNGSCFDNEFDIVELPDDALPGINELDGDLRLLAEIIGVRQAIRVAQVFNGTAIRIYGGKKWVRRHRDRCARRDYDSGNYTGVELARRYRVSERQIWNILGATEPAEDERQMKLF
ncbi:MAG TPA: hypothetical protein ENN06_12630 [Desulfobacteraceae bacterium]|nr:hypothetical protein [Desulfobacteraceae bacterium]